MQTKGFSHLKKITKASLDEDVAKEMAKCLYNLTTSGNPTLNESELKKFKKFCRKSDDYVRFAFILIMEQLEKKHSEIRLSAFQVATEIFTRSHAFREILVTNLQDFLTHTTGTETDHPLPPPNAAANKLKECTLRTVQQWYNDYGKSYRKLDVGYNYLKDCKHIDFQNIQAQNEATRLRAEQEKIRNKKQMADHLAKVMKTISENKPEIENCIKEAENCLKLLMPTPENFQLFTPIDTTQPNIFYETDQCRSGRNTPINNLKPEETFNTNLEYEKDEDESMSESNDEDQYDIHKIDEERAHGFGNSALSINIEVPVKNISVAETEDNTDVLQTLKDTFKLINSSFLPQVIKWLDVLGKNGGSQNDIKAIIDLKLNLESINMKCTDLKLVSTEILGDQDSGEDEDDFEDVPEKEGYEATVPTCVGYVVDVEKTGLKRHYSAETSTSDSCPKTTLLKKAKSFGSCWNLKERNTEESLVDPTSFASALARIKPSNTSTSENPSSSTCLPSTSKVESSNCSNPIPFVEYGKDLAYWENPEQIEVPDVIKLDSLHRFWASGDKETNKTSKHDIGLLLNRTFKFTGQFEPVKWSCRAPLKNGKLCPRKDRVKCPFHGPIIPRDEEGAPSVKQEPCVSTITKISQDNAEANTELPPWRDPELQREIEQATGHDLGSDRSQKLLDKTSKNGKGKGKGKKRSGLTDIKAASNTSRNRLEKRVFNKHSMRRVCATLDRADYKRVRDKFGNQFNYSL